MREQKRSYVTKGNEEISLPVTAITSVTKNIENEKRRMVKEKINDDGNDHDNNNNNDDDDDDNNGDDDDVQFQVAQRSTQKRNQRDYSSNWVTVNAIFPDYDNDGQASLNTMRFYVIGY